MHIAVRYRVYPNKAAGKPDGGAGWRMRHHRDEVSLCRQGYTHAAFQIWCRFPVDFFSFDSRFRKIAMCGHAAPPPPPCHRCLTYFKTAFRSILIVVHLRISPMRILSPAMRAFIFRRPPPSHPACHTARFSTKKASESAKPNSKTGAAVEADSSSGQVGCTVPLSSSHLAA